MPDLLEALSEADLTAVYNRYGVEDFDWVELECSTPDDEGCTPAQREQLAEWREEQRQELLQGVRERLCPLGFVGISCRARRK